MAPKKTYYEISDLAASKSFLGKEFLTWLWYYIEEEGGTFEVEQAINKKTIEAEIWIDDKITFESTGSDTARHSLFGGNPSDSLEATAALLTGKIVSELKLGLHIGEDQYKFGLSAKDLTPKSITIPKEPTSGDRYSAALFRIGHLDTLMRCQDAIFSQFVNTRIQASWEEESLQNLRSWISQRKEETQKLH